MALFGNSERDVLDVESAEYDDSGELLCPRCNTNHSTEVNTRHRPSFARRFLYCVNCGYNKEIDDGVLIFND